MELNSAVQLRKYWCHICKIHFPSQVVDIKCVQCLQNFCQEVTSENNPQAFVPFEIRKSKPRNLTRHYQQNFLIHQRQLQPVQQPSFETIIQLLRTQSQGGPPASKSQLQKLKRSTYNSERNQVNKECSVCQDEFQTGQPITSMPCSHIFHQKCILTWLDGRNSCPQCRFQLKTDDQEYQLNKKY